MAAGLAEAHAFLGVAEAELGHHPEWLEDQRRGRAIWWDRKVDLDEQKSRRESNEPHRSYPYDVNFEQQ